MKFNKLVAVVVFALLPNNPVTCRAMDTDEVPPLSVFALGQEPRIQIISVKSNAAGGKPSLLLSAEFMIDVNGEVSLDPQSSFGITIESNDSKVVKEEKGVIMPPEEIKSEGDRNLLQLITNTPKRIKVNVVTEVTAWPKTLYSLRISSVKWTNRGAAHWSSKKTSELDFPARGFTIR